MESTIAFDNTYAQLPEQFFAKLNPTPVKSPSLIALNEGLSESLGLDPKYLRSEQGLGALAGNRNFDGSEPLAMAYAGQQFGNWVPQLGDGRALLLGEVIDGDGVRHDIQLKGSGPTPYSRMGDGRAWLGPVMREYLVSEAIAALGVPTTRALSAVATGEQIIREAVLPGAILTRVSKSLIRVGTFQFFAARQDENSLAQLANYTIDRLYPDAKQAENPYVELLNRVVNAQANLVAQWMGVGFIHGVINTDNVSIAGETIDYGPCAFMDDFHPNRVFSSIDEGGRYAYSNQPRIAHWNLVQFAQSLLPLFDEDKEKAVAMAQEAIDAYPSIFQNAYQTVFNAKLGLAKLQDGDQELLNDLLKIMMDEGSDFTLTFRAMGEEQIDGLQGRLGETVETDDWIARWKMRQSSETNSAGKQRELSNASNPIFTPRNHRIEQAIRSGLEGDFKPFHKLNAALQKPFEDNPDNEELSRPPKPQEIVHATFCGT